MITLRKGGGMLTKRGAWRHVRLPDGQPGALIECPGCGRETSLRHPITAQGVVASWACAFDDCDKRAEIRLAGWAGGEQGWGGRA